MYPWIGTRNTFQPIFPFFCFSKKAQEKWSFVLGVTCDQVLFELVRCILLCKVGNWHRKSAFLLFTIKLLQRLFTTGAYNTILVFTWSQVSSCFSSREKSPSSSPSSHFLGLSRMKRKDRAGFTVLSTLCSGPSQQTPTASPLWKESLSRCSPPPPPGMEMSSVWVLIFFLPGKPWVNFTFPSLTKNDQLICMLP